METDKIPVEIVYASPARQKLIALCVPADCTVETAIDRSGITEIFPEIDLTLQNVGIFGKIVPLTARLKAGDRIEIYRHLLIDPKEARKNRARKQLKGGK